MSDKMANESPGPESEAMKQKVEDTTKRWRVLLQVITKRVEIIEEVVTLNEQFEEEIEIVVTFITITVKTLQDMKPVSYDEEPIEKEQEKLKVRLSDCWPYLLWCKSRDKRGRELMIVDSRVILVTRLPGYPLYLIVPNTIMYFIGVRT